MTELRPPWSPRRRRTLTWLAGGAVVLGIAALVLPAQFGVTAAFLAALCAFLFVAALVLFFAVPGPDTVGTLLRSSPLAGAVTVVAVLLWLSTEGQQLRWIWAAAAAGGLTWVATALWLSRRS
ncbi:hypothetical protein SAMN05660464_0350 [Geodermatophilus dictyosporus]|uniref:Uncharacterized protein n=1 Tax=Geodermatophilus dictyosporus TaxID=1523247 RepID=A0A1I5UP42_9ACTN|nr:hypothetical protein [Geodermatophilus dictyosporus]SFP97021.1 hypothetical protein SAMN05660464_0350 [Geodermatophilus dictyosporus]